MTRKLSAHGRKLKHAVSHEARTLSNPIARAVARSRIAQCRMETQKFLRRVSIRAYLADDGEKDLELLAILAILIGMGAEIGIKLNEDAPATRRMHAALRTVLGMAVAGGQWQAAQAQRMHEAATDAAAAFDAAPEMGLLMFTGAAELGQKIRLGMARMSDVNGAEIYNKQPACAVQAGMNSY